VVNLAALAAASYKIPSARKCSPASEGYEDGHMSKKSVHSAEISNSLVLSHQVSRYDEAAKFDEEIIAVIDGLNIASELEHMHKHETNDKTGVGIVLPNGGRRVD